MNEPILNNNATIKDVVRAIERSRRRIAVVVADDSRLIGTLTDGDVRRSLLAGGTLETLAVDAMNPEPATADVNSSENYLLDLMKSANVLMIPLVDQSGKFKRVVHITDLGQKEEYFITEFAAVVIMAGGEGVRLRPLTQKIPKPMIKINGIPVLERQIRRLAEAGLRCSYIAVNHLSHIIEEYFGDGSRFGISIKYLREKEKMGTAGALSLLPKLSDGPLLVVNGDILTTSDFNSLYNFHKDHKAQLTVAAVDYRIQIPYGVLHTEGHRLCRLEEKPSQRCFCNAGIYVLEQELLKRITSTSYDMTDMICDCLATKDLVSVFPVHEYWSDIGTPSDLEKTRVFFDQLSTDHD